MRILLFVSLVFAKKLKHDSRTTINCAECDGLMKNGIFLSGESCFDGTQNGWVEGHPSGDITPTCQTVTNNQTNVKLGFEQLYVKRDWSENSATTNSILKQSE